MEMKERQRWRSEEDAILLSYVHQHGPRDWHLISHRMNVPLNRDAKSCLERWKNYLKPGLKKGSLTPDEQRLVIALQRKYGNKWKKIASLVPGRTAKRLGKWWEVFKDKQHREDQLKLKLASRSDPIHIQPSVKYDRILESFAEKLMQNSDPPIMVPDPPISVALTLAPAPIGEFGGWWKEVEEGYEVWAAERKEASWRVRRVELQLEAEREGKKREKQEEIEGMIKELEEEKKRELERIEIDCVETMRKMRMEAEVKDMRLMEAWRDRHVRLRKVVDRLTVIKCGGIRRYAIWNCCK